MRTIDFQKLEDGSHEHIDEVPRNHKDSANVNEIFSRAKKIKALVVYYPEKASDDINSMMSMVSETELKLENTRHRNPEMVYRKLHPYIRRYPDYTVDDEGHMHIERKQNAFTFADNRAGMFVMLSSVDTS